MYSRRYETHKYGDHSMRTGVLNDIINRNSDVMRRV